MPIGVTDEQAALADSVARWAARHAPPEVRRADPDAAWAFWPSLAGQDLLGLAVPEERGGAGATAAELAVVVEALGRALVPGPFLPTAIAATAIGLHLPDGPLEGLLDGSAPATFAVRGGAPALAFPSPTGEGAAGASLLDPTRPLPRLDDRTPSILDLGAEGPARDVAITLAAAELAGVAAWCLDVAAEHAKVREQFGRPIGQFQAVKHACAEMLVHVEAIAATAWDAARALADPEQRPLAAAVAGAVALDGAVAVAKSCIQILGGIGYTWEHDAHRYLRRALALRQLLGPATAWRQRAAALALEGRRRTLDLDLSDAVAGNARAQARAFLATLDGQDDPARRRAMADGGWLAPHWPEPWGRGAGAVAQLAIDAEFRAAGVKRPDLFIGSWCLATIIAHGTREQQERFVPSTLRGELTWCQLFSEPGAGSDLAALQTKAVRGDGGWLLTGQKVWTSLAHTSDWGLALARTDPEAPRHQGITCFLVDMLCPGVEVRPLRELTGRAMFNEVFLSDVLVPDDCVVGAVNDGWRAGRTTLSNERVAMSSGSTMGSGVEGVLKLLGSHPDAANDPVVRDRAGALVAEGQVLGLLGYRTTLAQVTGHEPGPSASVRKLLSMRHVQDCAELQLEVLGPEGALLEGPGRWIGEGFLAGRALTIAGGTTEVQRNVIAERMLGLPRDPAPAAAPEERSGTSALAKGAR